MFIFLSIFISKYFFLFVIKLWNFLQFSRNDLYTENKLWTLYVIYVSSKYHISSFIKSMKL